MAANLSSKEFTMKTSTLKLALSLVLFSLASFSFSQENITVNGQRYQMLSVAVMEVSALTSDVQKPFWKQTVYAANAGLIFVETPFRLSDREYPFDFIGHAALVKMMQNVTSYAEKVPINTPKINPLQTHTKRIKHPPYYILIPYPPTLLML
jgi:hypothetical protein